MLLTTYRVAATYASHYSAVRTAISISALALAYGVLLPFTLDALCIGPWGVPELVRIGIAATVMVLGHLVSVRLLRRTHRARAVALSAQNRRHDDLLFHEHPEESGPLRHLDPETRAAWMIEPFPIFYEDLFRRFRGIRSGWRCGAANLAYLALTGFTVLLFLLLFFREMTVPQV